MIIDKLNQAKKHLDRQCASNNTSIFYNQAGFLLRVYEYFTSTNIKNISSTELKELSRSQIESLYAYNFSIGDGYSTVYDSDIRMAIVECDVNDVNRSLVNGLKSISNSLDTQKRNIILISFGLDNGVKYDKTVVEISKEFKSLHSDKNISIYTMDLRFEVTTHQYMARCLRPDSIDFSEIMPLELEITSQDILDNLEELVCENDNYYVTTEHSDTFTELHWWVTAYLSIRHNKRILIEDFSKITKYSSILRFLFSQEWNSFSARIKHLASIKDKNYIVDNRGIFTPCKVQTVKTMYSFKCLRFKEITNNIDEPVLRHLLEPETIHCGHELIMDSGSILKTLYNSTGNNARILLPLMRKIHVICMYHLTDRLVGWNDICWLLKDGELLFGLPVEHNKDIKVSLVIGNTLTEDIISTMDLIPATVFDSEFYSYKINDMGESNLEKIDLVTLNNLSSSIEGDPRYFEEYLANGLFQAALHSLGYNKSSKEEELYRLYISHLGKHIIDKLPIGLNGKLQSSLDLRSIL